MGTYSVYLNNDEKQKVLEVAKECGVKNSTPIKALVEYAPKDFLVQLVESYKERNNG